MPAAGAIRVVVNASAPSVEQQLVGGIEDALQALSAARLDRHVAELCFEVRRGVVHRVRETRSP